MTQPPASLREPPPRRSKIFRASPPASRLANRDLQQARILARQARWSQRRNPGGQRGLLQPQQHDNKPGKGSAGLVVLGESPQLPAARYCSRTAWDTRPRPETSMPLEAAQARTALRSTEADVDDLRPDRLPPVLRALVTHGSSASRSFLAFWSFRSISYCAPSI